MVVPPGDASSRQLTVVDPLRLLLASALFLLLGLWSLWSPQPAFAARDANDVQGATDVALRKVLTERHKDDLDGMVKRGLIRVLVTYSKTHYFVDKGQQHGMGYEAIVAFEKALRKRFVHRGKAPQVLIIPVARDELLPRLQQGLADLAVANLTVTAERSRVVDFSVPVLTGVSELVVSSRESRPLSAATDLAGRAVVVRRSSSHFESLRRFNVQLKKQGRRPVRIVEADEHLETEDLLDMANAGLIDYTVADAHLARLWAGIFTGIRVEEKAVLASGENIAWAVRKGAPKLLAEVNGFVRKHRAGTTFGNVLRNRYLKDPHWAKRAMAAAERDRFKRLEPVFRTYAKRYGIDPLLLLAQGFQESGLDQNRRSAVGAIGIMQLMPNTGKALQVGDVRRLEANVHGGAKYLRHLMDDYFSEPRISAVDRLLFAIAAYNAGPNRIQKLRKQTAANGMNPDVWTGHVERSVARYVGQETVQYVANISKYYIAYRLIAEQEAKKRQSLSRQSDSRQETTAG